MMSDGVKRGNLQLSSVGRVTPCAPFIEPDCCAHRVPHPGFQERYCSTRIVAVRLLQLKSKKQSIRTKPSGSAKVQLEKPKPGAPLISKAMRRPLWQIGLMLMGLTLLLLIGLEVVLRLFG